MTPATNPADNARLHSALSGRPLRRKDAMALNTLRPDLLELIRQDHPAADPDGFASRMEIAAYRTRQVEAMMHLEQRDITVLEREVIDSLDRHKTVTDNIEQEFEEKRSFGELAADRVAEFGGSWTFILAFAAVLVVWMAVNVGLAARAFDPYPFILLNLVLSCLAAVQAPIIMMSQRRTEAKDRARSLNDYQVNLKAELEIRHLHEKIDHLMTRQWERLTELQCMQIEMLQEINHCRPPHLPQPAGGPDAHPATGENADDQPAEKR